MFCIRVNELIKQSISYILDHLEENISIEDVANQCHLSKYYFCRIFKLETGESLYGFIKRMKMEQSALNIKLEKERAITDIGVEYGYSASNYSSAFRKHHKISPVQFRKNINREYMVNPFLLNEMSNFDSFKEYDEKIIIEEFDDFVVFYERHIGNYTDLGENWRNFIEKYNWYFTEDTLLIERFYDDPSITGIEHCLYDICMTVDENCLLDDITTIEGGKFARYRFEGNISDIFASFQGVFNVWLPNSDFEMDERYGIDIYRNMNMKNNCVIVDLCIPVK